MRQTACIFIYNKSYFVIKSTVLFFFLFCFSESFILILGKYGQFGLIKLH